MCGVSMYELSMFGRVETGISTAMVVVTEAAPTSMVDNIPRKIRHPSQPNTLPFVT